MAASAILVLEDGSLFRGISIGAEGTALGEVVFNTAMSGYQEVLTDPSYASQLITFTAPHVGNVGVNPDDFESDKVWASGAIIKDYPTSYSSWRGQQSLSQFFKEQGIVAIAGIDTRALTALLREKGALNGCITTEYDDYEAMSRARGFEGLVGKDLAKVVSTEKMYTWQQGTWQPGKGFVAREASELPYHVVAYDFGIKRAILRQLVDVGCRVTVVPAQTPASDVLSLHPDGVFLSNGPGDPEPCGYAIEAIKTLVKSKLPIFGICLGHQLLALASGAKTLKMKFGHHGANHPVKDLNLGTVAITSQNHGFAVSEASLPDYVKPTHRSLFDGSLQGITRTDCVAFSFQGHPEASPGPLDCTHLFKQFAEHMAAARQDETEETTDTTETAIA